MTNPYKRLLRLVPGQSIDTGEILDVHDDGVTVQLLTGALVRARGTGTIGDHVYLQDGAVAGPAPDLQGVEQEV